MENNVAIHESRSSEKVVKFIALETLSQEIQNLIESGNLHGIYFNEQSEMVAEDIWQNTFLLNTIHINMDNTDKIYRLMNHDSTHEKPRFESFSLEEYEKEFGKRYSSPQEASDNDPEYCFTLTEMEYYLSKDE